MTANEYLRREAQSGCTVRTLVAQGVLWAEASCRIDGTMALALRQASEAQASELVDRMIQADCDTMADAARWLNANRSFVLEVLK